MKKEICIIDDGNFKLLIEFKEAIEDRTEEYKLVRARTHELDDVLKRIPTLIIINEDRLQIDIAKLVNIIKNDDDNSITPIIVVSENSSKSHKIELLKSDILYYIRKPFESEFIFRIITNLMTLLKINRRVSPLTGLPGNVQINTELKKKVLNNKPFYMLYLDLDNFKAYNDIYGFTEGDEVIKYTASVITRNILSNNDLESAFVGHIGGDDFTAMFEKGNVIQVCEKILDDFDEGIKRFFTKEDLEKGYIEVPNRRGIIEQFPLTTLSIGVVKVTKDKYKNILEIGEVGSQVKKKAKQIIGSSYYMDKREFEKVKKDYPDYVPYKRYNNSKD